MKQYQYQTTGTCSRMINIEVNDDNTLGDVTFVGGCHGNLQGIGRLVKGMKLEDVISRLEGIKCGAKPTSCPDQLAKALSSIKELGD
ncbi:MAG: TIGR03905 family TSCPD domain-containing protein [Muribaculaceae bacterium]